MYSHVYQHTCTFNVIVNAEHHARSQVQVFRCVIIGSLFLGARFVENLHIFIQVHQLAQHM